MRATILMVAVLLAGCAAPTLPLHPAAPGPSAPAIAPLVSYLHDVTPADATLTLARALLAHARVPLTDGLTLDSWIARPNVDHPVPLVLEITPYFGGGSPATNTCPGLTPTQSCFSPWGDYLMAHGYAVGIVSVRGTGQSEGCFTIGGPQEAKDSAAAIEYWARQSWSNGKVGLIGVSYPGTTPQDVWVEAPPSLKAIVPIEGITDLYKYNFVNGVPINVQGFGFNTYYWATVGLAPAGLEGGSPALDPVAVPGIVRGEACTDQADVQRAGVQSTLDGNKSPYWQARDFLAEYRAQPDKPRAAFFYVQGFQDWNVKPHNAQDWLPAIEASGVPFKAWLGQWAHNWPDGTFGKCTVNLTCRADWWNETVIAWFDQFLKGIDTGILDAPPIQVQDDDRQWRHDTAWPPLDAQPLTLHPDLGGALQREPGAGTATYYDYQGRLQDRPGPQGPDRVAFASDPLSRDLHLTGFPRFVANVTATGQRASLILTLVERNATGERPLNYGVLSLNHAGSLTQGDPNIAGKKVAVDLRFFPQENVVHKGSRLVLYFGANAIGDKPSVQPVSDGSTIRVDLGGAQLTLFDQPTPVYETPQPFQPKTAGQ